MSDQLVRAACVASFAAWKNDCSGFARAVANEAGVQLVGLADDIVETLRTGDGWTQLADGPAAAQSALDGLLVLAGLKGAEQTIPDVHGHVVVVVGGTLASGQYPSAYWGSLGGSPGQDQTLNWAWTAGDRDRVTYSAHPLGI